jgi:tetratricopeptide (TPR) repeat protein
MMSTLLIVVTLFVGVALFAAPRFYYQFFMARGEALFYRDTERSEAALRRAAAVPVSDPWADIFLARHMMRREDTESASRHIQRAFERLPDDNSVDHFILLNEAGKLARQQGEHETALVHFRESLSMVQSLQDERHEAGRLAEDAAVGTLNISRALYELGRLEEALDYAQTSLEQRRDLISFNFGEASAMRLPPERVRLVAVAQSDIGRILADLERPEEALASFEEAFETYGAELNSNTALQARWEQSIAQRHIGDLHGDAGNLQSALAAYDLALDLLKSIRERDPAYPGVTLSYQAIVLRMARIYAENPNQAGYESFVSDHVHGEIFTQSHSNAAIWAQAYEGDRLAAMGDTQSAYDTYQSALEKAEQRVREASADPDLRRDIWILHLRAAKLELNSSPAHAQSALDLMESLDREGVLAEPDRQYLEEARLLAASD